MSNDEWLNSPPVHLPVPYIPVGVELLMLIIMVIEGVRPQLLLEVLLHGHSRLAVALQMRLAVLVPLFEDQLTHGLVQYLEKLVTERTYPESTGDLGELQR